MTLGKQMSHRQACDYWGMGRYMTGHGEGQVSRYYPICGPPLAYKRGGDASGHVANITRDRPLGYPKGLAMKKRKPAAVASQEAYEEAGLIGQIVGRRPLGRFHYEKRVGKEAILCQVRVFLFRVERQLDDWPEKGQRETKWFEASEAASLVEEGGLAEIIDRFSGSYVRFVAFREF